MRTEKNNSRSQGRAAGKAANSKTPPTPSIPKIEKFIEALTAIYHYKPKGFDDMFTHVGVQSIIQDIVKQAPLGDPINDLLGEKAFFTSRIKEWETLAANLRAPGIPHPDVARQYAAQIEQYVNRRKMNNLEKVNLILVDDPGPELRKLYQRIQGNDSRLNREVIEQVGTETALNAVRELTKKAPERGREFINKMYALLTFDSELDLADLGLN